jgi:hypothetical protein
VISVALFVGFSSAQNSGTQNAAAQNAAAQNTNATQASTDVLVPRMHLVYGHESGDPVRLYFDLKRPLEPKDVKIAGLKLREWRVLTAFGKPSLELTVDMKPGLDTEFDTITLKMPSGTVRAVAGPNRVIYLKPRDRYEISFERMEQLPNQRLYLGMRIFNDADQIITIERIIYAPKAASTNQMLINPAYEDEWFDQLERWSKAGTSASSALPRGAKWMDAGKLNLRVQASRGFSAAIVESSFKPAFSCLRKGVPPNPNKRRDSAFLQGLIQYRVGNGLLQTYPIPDDVMAEVCL